MSLILDALNRSQKERDNSREVPGISTQHWVEPLPPAGRWQRGLPWLGLVIALAVIVWLLLGNKDNKLEAVGREPPAQAIESPAEAGQNKASDKTASVPSVSPLKEAENNISPKPVLPSSIQSPKATVGSATSRSTLTSGTGDTAVADLYKSAAPQKAPSRETVKPAQSKPTAPPKSRSRSISGAKEEPIDIEKMIALARGEAENLELPEHSAPFLSELSQQSKDRIPTIYYSQHDYSAIEGQSTVILNGEPVREGGKVAGSLKLVEILPQSIVLSDRGKEFRLKALNSWINL